MRWKELAGHLDHESAWALLNFCGWVEGEIEDLEEAGPLSAQHKKIKKLVKERAVQHEHDEQFHTKNSVTANFSDGRTRHVDSRTDLELLGASVSEQH